MKAQPEQFSFCQQLNLYQDYSQSALPEGCGPPAVSIFKVVGLSVPCSISLTPHCLINVHIIQLILLNCNIMYKVIQAIILQQERSTDMGKALYEMFFFFHKPIELISHRGGKGLYLSHNFKCPVRIIFNRLQTLQSTNSNYLV